MAYAAKILADSISLAGHRLTTFEVTFPRIVLAEVNTHKMLSKNSASSRAIPVADKIAAVLADPFVPAAFGKNQKGMQAETALTGEDERRALFAWEEAMGRAIKWAGELASIGVHKQLANRLVEPFSWHTAIISGTDWQNFWNLRVHPAAQGEFSYAAAMMKELYASSDPDPIDPGGWHLPLVRGVEYDGWDLEVAGIKDKDLAKISAARCGRVSFMRHNIDNPPEKDIARAEQFAIDGHLSPLEHPARPMHEWELDAYEQYEVDVWVEGDGSRTMRMSGDFLRDVQEKRLDSNYPDIRMIGEPRRVHYCGNYNGWVQLRKLVVGEAVFQGGRS